MSQSSTNWIVPAALDIFGLACTALLARHAEAPFHRRSARARSVRIPDEAIRVGRVDRRQARLLDQLLTELQLQGRVSLLADRMPWWAIGRRKRVIK